jgi:hypothetical protein
MNSIYRFNKIFSKLKVGKVRCVETLPGMRGIKENDGGDEFSYDTL